MDNPGLEGVEDDSGAGPPAATDLQNRGSCRKIGLFPEPAGFEVLLDDPGGVVDDPPFGPVEFHDECLTCLKCLKCLKLKAARAQVVIRKG